MGKVSAKFGGLVLGCGLALGVFGLLLPGCGPDNKTGMWFRVVSPRVPIDQVVLHVFDEGEDGSTLIIKNVVDLGEADTYLASATNPDNQRWVLILAGPTYREGAIRVEGTGMRNDREVAYGELPALQFRKGKIFDAPEVLELDHSGRDDDQDTYYVPDDCDDTDALVHPGQTEFCGDEKDNNCDGSIDETCPCATGEVRECWPHWAELPQGLPCKPGTQTCVQGTWGACEGLTLPNPESCPDESFDCFPCGDEIDNDCDGFLDKYDTGCGGCLVDTWETCYTGPEGTAGIGVCQFGQKLCIDGTYGFCENEVLPEGCTPPSEPEQPADCPEISEFGFCNGFDDDCDGLTDNVTEAPTCDVQLGVCAGAVRSCIQGQWVNCDDADYEANAVAKLCGEVDEPLCCTEADLTCYALEETTRLCDDLDNDCNSFDDDAVDGACFCDTGDQKVCPPSIQNPNEGACVEGVSNCVNGDWIDDDVCVRQADEACDNVDNNCDGTIDRHPQADDHCRQNQQANADLQGCFDGICVWNCWRNVGGDQIAYDLNGDSNQPGGSISGDGCEYLCTLTVPANEVCDGLDNDCDNLLDGLDQVSAAVLCPVRTNASASQCLSPRVCDYTCNAPFGDCDTDLGELISLPGEPAYSGNGCETNLSLDNLHCGTCGTTCDNNETCVGSACSCGGSGSDCTFPDICCGTQCYDSLTDESFCGSCNTSCDQNELCNSGACRCGGSGSDCSGANNNFCCGTNCVDLNNDESHCGDCITTCHQNEQCLSGGCRCGGSGPNCAGTTGSFCCGTECVDLNNDERYCGDCGTSCDTNELCSSGSCRCGGSGADCTGATTNFCCGTSCVNRTSDESNCGSCGNTCTNPNGSTNCLSSVCVPSCASGYADCDGDPDDGCEENIWETNDCGSTCGNRVNCINQVDNATSPWCNSGSCDYGSCNTRFGDCDGDRSDGCEADLWLIASCGTTCGNRVNCSNRIQNASGVVCSSGACDYGSCDAGYDNCNADRTDGCETDIWQANSCGSNCGNRVNCNGLVQNASGISCNSGDCGYAACNSGYADCDGDPTNGCEENIWETADCGSTCFNRANCNGQVQNASGVNCNAGDCAYSSCNSGWGDCDGDPTDGCEISIWQTASCGSTCGNRLNCTTEVQNASGVLCSSGSCDYGSCTGTYEDCDGDRTDGCELDLERTVTCGTTCGNWVNCNGQVQNASGIGCSLGACTYLTCNAGFGDCDGDSTDGCEHDIWQTSDCGSTCVNGTDCNSDIEHASGATCASGACDFSTCTSGWGNCDADDTNGCEHDIWQTADCGSTCVNGTDCNSDVLNASGKTCTSGACDYSACTAGFGDCNADTTDGCEADIWQTASCGTTCGNRVDCNSEVLHATGISCGSGACDYTSCDADWDNCDADDTNGCEGDLTLPTTCGDCGTDCTAATYDTACYDDGTWRCGCTADGDCGGVRPVCNTGQHDCQ